jgi:hypothetical protein
MKSERKKHLGMSMHRWDDNINTDLTETGKVWTDLHGSRRESMTGSVTKVMNLLVPQKVENFLNSSVIIGFSLLSCRLIPDAFTVYCHML